MEEQRVAIMRTTSIKKTSVTQSVTITRGGCVLSMLSLGITIHIILSYTSETATTLDFHIL